MNYFINGIKDLFGNYMLVCAVCGWLFAQIIKTVIGLICHQHFSFTKLLFSNGGMPSSHSAAVTALATACALKTGLGSPHFAISALLAFIVMNDAAVVRRVTGKQSEILNQMIPEVFSEEAGEREADLKEKVGHTPKQVIVGAISGFLVAVVMGFLMQEISL